ncbi:3-oxo-tetronate kinase [Vibrio algivorus]|uniref:3-oxo-tetronate kinase n=1 Tax=Vibrio algivorus TaxID=1667024 RepID=A0A557P0A1_9VIBR|nr:3-oxo-tetronate kinase [Vibrio algivorus]TVO34091.1 four-carbon acid sugar kinase family protein [Vibrio algivorus]
MLLGVIADDFTGATDIAGFLVENGMRTIQVNGIPSQPLETNTDAVVVSLKSRSCPTKQAITDSLQALEWLKQQGCQQFYFKYCSTFDSTPQGNIGPVTDALLNALNEDFTIVCPALPVNGRTVFNGHLFVMGQLLSESGMRHHPVTPMTDSNLIHLMNAQSQGETGLVNYQTIEQGVSHIQARFTQLKTEGKRYAVVDAFKAEHLDMIGASITKLKLTTGGSGLAAGIAKNWGEYLQDQADAKQAGYPHKAATVIFSGSCSGMTNKQVNAYKDKAPHFAINIDQCLNQESYSDEVFDWVVNHLDQEMAPMVYATADTSDLKNIQQQYGAQASSEAVEQLFSQLAIKLQTFGVRNFIVAGGETSGVVTQSLQVDGFHIGPQIAPGVPWVKSINSDLSLALKSGNFGNEAFFTAAQEYFK